MKRTYKETKPPTKPQPRASPSVPASSAVYIPVHYDPSAFAVHGFETAAGSGCIAVTIRVAVPPELHGKMDVVSLAMSREVAEALVKEIQRSISGPLVMPVVTHEYEPVGEKK